MFVLNHEAIKFPDLAHILSYSSHFASYYVNIIFHLLLQRPILSIFYLYICIVKQIKNTNAMKSLFINILMIVMMCPLLVTANVKDGKNKKEVEVAKYTINYDGSSFILVYKTFTERPVNIFIYNEKSQLIYTDHIKGAGIVSRPYNFKEMKAGNYTFKIVESNRVVTHHVNYSPVVKPVSKINVENNDGKYKLSVIGSIEKPVKVNIYNEQNNLIFSESIKEQTSFSKIYNLGNTTHCSFEVSVDQTVYQKTF